MRDRRFVFMDWRNRIGLYGSYFLGMAGIGFTLPFLPLYLGQEGMSDRAIGLVSTLAALASLVQYSVGLWSDRLGSRKRFLVAALALLAASTFLLGSAHDLVWLSFLVVLFAENGICRATMESLAGAEAASLAAPGKVGAALGALRFWKPVSIVLVALGAGSLAGRVGVAAVLLPLGFVQALAVALALLIHENGRPAPSEEQVRDKPLAAVKDVDGRDWVLWMFVGAMVLFHVANAPGGVYLGLFLKRDLGAAEQTLSHAFVVRMLAWMAVVYCAGGLADRIGRRPLLIAGWTAMAVRLALVSVAAEPWQVLAVQTLDGTAQALFVVAAAAGGYRSVGRPQARRRGAGAGRRRAGVRVGRRPDAFGPGRGRAGLPRHVRPARRRRRPGDGDRHPIRSRTGARRRQAAGIRGASHRIGLGPRREGVMRGRSARSCAARISVEPPIG
jgi:MFS family permease